MAAYFTRRDFLKTIGAGAALASIHRTGPAAQSRPGRIDRHALVTRHNVTLTKLDPKCPLVVGNGEFAFSTDITGLQSFQENLGTFSQWGWHSFPNPEGYRYEEVLFQFDSNGRKVPYAQPWVKELPPDQQRSVHGRRSKYASVPITEGRLQRAYFYYRMSPHRLHLGRIGLTLLRSDGKPATHKNLKDISQTLGLWSGSIHSRFTLEGKPVEVVTACHPRRDLLAVTVRSPLIAEGRIKIFWHFPYVNTTRATPSWAAEDEPKHATEIVKRGKARADVHRILDKDEYHAAIAWSPGCELAEAGPHRLELTPSRYAEGFEFVTAFAPQPIGDELPAGSQTVQDAADHWKSFWSNGGAIDLSESKDPRWRELERRIVLSQYLTAANSSGSAPPQESGLVSNSWYGKFHLEMTAWHGVHFALWGRERLLDGWMKWALEKGLPAARRQAKSQGYAGARWNKMIDRDAVWETPSGAGPFRATQQGHMIYIPELLYRVDPKRETLEHYKDIVFESAEFMADFAAWDEKTKRYVIGPPIMSGSEHTVPWETQNSTVELSYWAYGLQTAQEWRRRLGLPPEPKWDKVLKGLSRPPVKDGMYLDAESHPEKVAGRPAWLEAYGCMPGVNIDPAVMARNLDGVVGDFKSWDKWIWGCDFPMLAMTAARLGRPGQAIDLLMLEWPRNEYLANGFNSAGSWPYLPASGGLLWAAAMLAAGWDGAPRRHAPGFPDNGNWVVKWEGLRPTP